MRSTALPGLAILTALAATTTPAMARYAYQRAPWCAQYSLPGGPMSCNFATLEQCRAQVSGVGGMCNVNPYLGYGAANAYGSQPRARRTVRKQRRR
jgi:hypothetical protein